ncbi:phosphoesterase family-domain-containing protein, partial [Chytriomyces sp. MP71]
MSVPFSPRNPVLGVSANTTFLTAQNDPSVHAYFPSSVVPCVRNVFTVVLENQDYADVMADPYMGTTLANKGYLMTNYYANTHPSQGNYIAMIAGSLFGVTDDSNVDLNGKNVADLLEAKGLTWKSYQEAYPGECFTGQISGTYWRKHNPFISFTSISKNASRCANIVSSVQLDKDAVAGNLPNYIFYSPDINNDGHDTGLTVASNWLKAFLEPKLTDPAYANTLFQVVFDESQNNIPSQNRIYALLAGAGITQQGARDNSSYTHYNLLATLENVFSLGNLGQNDVAAA